MLIKAITYPVACLLPVLLLALMGHRSHTTYQMIPVSAFQKGTADDKTWDFGNIGAGGARGSIVKGNPPYEVTLFAPVNLPHEAIVTGLTAYYWDQSPTADLSSLQLSLAYQGGGAVFGMTSVNVSTTGTSSQIRSASTTAISNPHIDNTSNRVWLTLRMKVTSPSVELGFYGARIEYNTR